MIDRLMQFGAGRIALLMTALMLTKIVVSAGAAAVAIAASSLASSSSGVAAPDAPPADDDPPEQTVDDAVDPQPSDPAPSPFENARPPLPTNCESVYSPAMIAQLQSYGVVVNPSWSSAELGSGVSYESPELIEYLTTLPHLRCFWGSPSGGSGFGIETRIVPVTPDEAATVQARLASLGYDQADELGSTRYLYGVAASEYGAAYGESHIVVGGYWFATSWLELGITGYTADMVTTLLG